MRPLLYHARFVFAVESFKKGCAKCRSDEFMACWGRTNYVFLHFLVELTLAFLSSEYPKSIYGKYMVIKMKNVVCEAWFWCCFPSLIRLI